MPENIMSILIFGISLIGLVVLMMFFKGRLQQLFKIIIVLYIAGCSIFLLVKPYIE